VRGSGFATRYEGPSCKRGHEDEWRRGGAETRRNPRFQAPRLVFFENLTQVIAGVISDTHGLLRPEAIAALKGSDLIIHAGDRGKPEILDEWRRIAPTFAVRGNVDTAPWAAALPMTEVVEAGSLQIYVRHDLGTLDLDPRAAGFAAVISGHSHKPLAD